MKPELSIGGYAPVAVGQLAFGPPSWTITSSHSCPGSLSTFFRWRSDGADGTTVPPPLGSSLEARLKPSLNVVGAPLGSTPTIPLMPNTWSNERFSRARTKTCSIFFCFERLPPNSDLNPSMIERSRQRSQSHATHTSWSTQAKTMQMDFTTQAKALHTHFATQYQPLHTQWATQYQPLQNHSTTQFQNVYQWHSEPHSSHFS